MNIFHQDQNYFSKKPFQWITIFFQTASVNPEPRLTETRIILSCICNISNKILKHQLFFVKK